MSKPRSCNTDSRRGMAPACTGASAGLARELPDGREYCMEI